MINHHIQKEIMNKLIRMGSLRYKDIKIDGLEASHFVYHLKTLIRNKLVAKSSTGEYKLTSYGFGFAQNYSTDNNNTSNITPAYLIFCIKSKNNKWALNIRNREPFINRYSLISGKIHKFNTIKKSIQHEIAEFSANKQDLQINNTGFASIIIEDGDIKTHILGLIYYIECADELEINTNYRKGEIKWFELNDILSMDKSRILPGTMEIIKVVNSGSLEPLDITISV